MTTPSDHSKKPAADKKPTPPQFFDESAFLNEPEPDRGEDSSVDLGHPVSAVDPLNPSHPGSQSGISVVDWASLVEDVPAPPPQPVMFDAASDAELLFPSVPVAPVVPHAETTVQKPGAASTIHAPAGALPPAAKAPPAPAQPLEEEPPMADVDEEVVVMEAEEEPQSTAPAQPEATLMMDEDDVAAFLADSPEPPPAQPEQAVEVIEEATAMIDEDGVAAFLTDAHEPPPAQPEPVEEVLEVETAVMDEDDVAAFLADSPEPPPAQPAPVEEVHEVATAVIDEDEVAALLAETPEPPPAQPAPVVQKATVSPEDYIATLLAGLSAPAPAPAAPVVPPVAAQPAVEVIEESAAEVAVEAVEDTTIASADEVAAFLADEPAPALPAPVEAAVEAVEETTIASADEVAAFLADEPAPALPAPVEAVEDTTVASADEVAAFLADEPAPALPARVEAAVEDTTVASADEVAAFLAEEPEPALPVAAEAAVEAIEEATIVSEDDVSAFLADAPAPPVLPSGTLAAEVNFLADVEETANTPQPISEMARAEEAAFAAPEEMAEEVAFTPEAMFEDHSLPAAASGHAHAPRMELDSGRKLDDVVELGADAVVTGQSGADSSGVIPVVVEDDEEVVAEVADEVIAVESAVVADAAEVEDVVDFAQDEVLELGNEAVVSPSSAHLSQLVAEVVESDVAVPPAVPESEVIVAEYESGIDVGAGASDPNKPISSGDVVMAADAVDAGSSGRDLIAEAVESGIDGTLAMPGMEVVDSEVTIAPDSARKMHPDMPASSREYEATREIQIPPAPSDPDDFFTANEAVVVEEGGEVVLGAEVEEVATASQSSSIDLGSMPEMPILPSDSKASSEAADIDLDALEQAATASQRGVGKATAAGEIDLGSPSATGEDEWNEAGTVAMPGVVDEAEIDFSTLEDAAAGSAAKGGGSTVGYEAALESSPTADIDVPASGVGVAEDAEVVEDAAVEQSFVEDAVFDDENTVAAEDEGELVGAVVGEEDEEEEKPKKGKGKPVKAPGRGLAWFGGMAIGGVGTGVALLATGLLVLPFNKTETPKTGKKPDEQQVVVAPATLARQQITGGTRGPEIVQNLPPTIPEAQKLYLEGLIAWRDYSQKLVKDTPEGMDPKPNLEDEQAKTAIEKLKKSATAEAYFTLGQIYEKVGVMEEAKKNYELGKIEAKDDEKKKKRFADCLERLEATAVSALPRFDAQPEIQLALLAMLVFAGDEAGAANAGEAARKAFNEAIKELNKKDMRDFTKALASLKSAASYHKRARLLTLPSSLDDPTDSSFGSDPTGAIFQRFVEESVAYCELRKLLVDDKIVTADKADYAGIKAAVATAKAQGSAAIVKILKEEFKLIGKDEDLEDEIRRLITTRINLVKSLNAPAAEDEATKTAGDKAIDSFLMANGGYDRLKKESEALLEVLKKVSPADKDATMVTPEKREELKKNVSDLVAFVDDAVTGLVASAETITDLQDQLTAKKAALVKAEKLSSEFVKVLAQALIDAGHWPKEKENELTKEVVLATSAMILRIKLPGEMNKVIQDNLGLRVLVTQLEGTINLAVGWWSRDVANLTVQHVEATRLLNEQHTQAVKKLQMDHADAMAKLNGTITELQETVALAVAWWDAEVTELNALQVKAIAKIRADHAKDLEKVHTPEQMLPLWLALLENRDNPAFVAATAKDAQTDAQNVINDNKKKEDAIKAKVLQGLALRNLGQYAAAEKILADVEKELKDLPPQDAAWIVSVADALFESRNVVAYYSKKADELANHIYPDKAIALIDRMLPAAPDAEKGRLLAQRSLLRLETALEQATTDGRSIRRNDPLVQEAIKNSEAAGDTAAGHYSRGRVHEELNDMKEAEKEFRKAVEMHKIDDEKMSLYRAALARALTAPRVGRLERDDDAGALALAPAEEERLTLVLLTVMLQQPPPPAPACPFPLPFFTFLLPAGEDNGGLVPLSPEQQEADKLAQQILDDPKAPFDAKAKAWMAKGDYTQALKVFADGIQKNKLMRADHAATLKRIIDENPRLIRDARPSNPLEAENFYGNGLRFYYAGQYPSAEKQFRAAVFAVDGDAEDARYFYFLGLAQLAQGKNKEARQSFADGAALERRSMPSRVAVNASLERIQFQLRRVLDDERNR